MLNTLLRAARLGLYWLLDRLVMLAPHQPSDTALVIRLDGIGDFVVWLQSGAADIVGALRKQHSRVVLVANQAWASLAADLGAFDEVIAVDPARFMRRPFYRLRMLRRVRQLQARTTVQPRSARVFLQEDEIVKVAGSATRIGAQASPINMSARLVGYASRYYSSIVPVDHTTRRHESAKNIDFAKGVCGYTGAIFAPGLLPGSSALPKPARYAVLAPGAGWTGRQWPAARFAELASRIKGTADMAFIILGSAADSGLARQIREGAPDVPFEDWTGKLNLTETVNLIARAKLVVSNESGPMHIAVWCGTPVVGVVGGGHFGWFAPYPPGFPNAEVLRVVNQPMPCYGCDWRCVFPVAPGDGVPCIKDIPVEHVLAEAIASLD